MHSKVNQEPVLNKSNKQKLFFQVQPLDFSELSTCDIHSM